ncbi:hypothetical protein [Pseudonocardia lacus]|uniref:hypothetical protein n=1 Tax=Pseudonocardia lacus TaxID=2835865 RepID=UPI001BDC3F1C|nr:hypothetical protein [Pseudonocardia lacus]
MTSTAADRREFLESGLVTVDCTRCGAAVRVRKTSAEHTSIQWTADAQRRCPAFDPRTGCPDLRGDIDRAVAQGRLPLVGVAAVSAESP